jgi:hypothetical protein
MNQTQDLKDLLRGIVDGIAWGEMFLGVDPDFAALRAAAEGVLAKLEAQS